MMNAQETIAELFKFKLSRWEHGYLTGLSGNPSPTTRQLSSLAKIKQRHFAQAEQNRTINDEHPPEQSS
jgi:hypothetical protein